MKRIAAILTSLVLVFSLAACGSQQAGTAAGSEAASTAHRKPPPRQKGTSLRRTDQNRGAAFGRGKRYSDREQ